MAVNGRDQFAYSSPMCEFGGLLASIIAAADATVVVNRRLPDPSSRSDYSMAHIEIPIFRALSTRLALMPLPGQATTALGNASII